jgi:hypothetical protein
MNTPALKPADARADDLLSAIEVRRMLGGVSDVTLSRWMNDARVGLPRPVKFGARLNARRFWRRGDINRFIEAQRGSGPAGTRDSDREAATPAADVGGTPPGAFF